MRGWGKGCHMEIGDHPGREALPQCSAPNSEKQRLKEGDTEAQEPQLCPKKKEERSPERPT